MTIPGISLPNDRYRRTAGFVLGSLAGLTYAAVYQLGDQIALPGVPLYRPPFGLAGNLALFSLGAGLLGLIAAWPRSGVLGTFVAAALSAAVIVGSAFLNAHQNLATSVVVGLILALPFWGLLVPIIGALRWVVSHDEEARRDGQGWYRRAVQPLVLLLVVGFVGLTALYRSDARILIWNMNEMLREAQAGGELPEPLATTSFAARGQGKYELVWEGQGIERYGIPRPGKNFDQHSVVVARFENGWNVVCLYIDSADPPLCKDVEAVTP